LKLHNPILAGLELGFQCFPAPILYGINSATGNLVRFSADNLASVTSIPITGLVGGDIIIGLDFRPATGQLYGLSGGSRLYGIDPKLDEVIELRRDIGVFAPRERIVPP
jgi:hypothetical protein